MNNLFTCAVGTYGSYLFIKAHFGNEMILVSVQDYPVDWHCGLSGANAASNIWKVGR